jgi:hypothetical protein
MSTPPFQLIWSNSFNVPITAAGFPVSFPGTTSTAQLLEVATNAITLQTYESLVQVGFFLVGDADDINTVQFVWPTLGGATKPQLNGGVDISFDSGQTYTRFDPTHGVQSNPSTWIPLPAISVGAQGTDETIGAFDISHFIVRYVIPPGATQFGILNISLGLGFDIL